MNRREFLRHSAVSGLIAGYPTILYSQSAIRVQPSGVDDLHAINAALRASARISTPVVLDEGVYTITNAIFVVSGSSLIGNGESTLINFEGGDSGVVVRIEAPAIEGSVKSLFVRDLRSPVPFVSLIG